MFHIQQYKNKIEVSFGYDPINISILKEITPKAFYNPSKKCWVINTESEQQLKDLCEQNNICFTFNRTEKHLDEYDNNKQVEILIEEDHLKIKNMPFKLSEILLNYYATKSNDDLTKITPDRMNYVFGRIKELKLKIYMHY